jgi:hypothetical protein
MHDDSPATSAVPAFRDGSHVVIADGGTLPARCIKCNAPASGSPIRYAFVNNNAPGEPHGVTSAKSPVASRRVARVYINVCSWHRMMRTLIRIGCPAVLLLAAGVGTYANFAQPKPPDMVLHVSVAAALAAMLTVGLYQQRYIKGNVRGEEVWISGAGEAFLKTLPAKTRKA